MTKALKAIPLLVVAFADATAAQNSAGAVNETGRERQRPRDRHSGSGANDSYRCRGSSGTKQPSTINRRRTMIAGTTMP